MKKIKKISGICAATLVLAMGGLFVPTLTAKAAGAVDITNNVSASGWTDHQDLRVTYLDLGENVEPAIGYKIIDGDYTYVQDYVMINGRTIKDINTNVDDSAYVYSTFPSTIDNPIYKVPVIVQVNNGKLEIKIHDNYVATLGDYVQITVKAGLYFENDGTRYEVTADKTFTVFGTKPTEVDITDGVTIDNWLKVGNAQELTYTMIYFPEGVLPEISYSAMDTDEWKYVQEYITINGKTVKEINETTDASAYQFATFPSTAADIYKVPVILYENGNALEVKIHNSYLETLQGDITISLKEGFSIVQGANKYVVCEDVSLVVEGTKEIDIAGEIAINGWWTTGDAQELTYTTINFPEGVLPGIIAYSAMDKAAWMYLQEYIALNGRTVKEINETTDTSAYQFATFPSTAADIYKVPVIIYENGNNLEVKFHNNYLKTLGDTLEITVKAGLSIVDGNTKYVVGSDVTKTVLEVVEEDLSGNVSVSGWYAAGDAQELTYTRIEFPKGVLSDSIDYDVTDKAAWMYLQEYICLNGKSIKEINETTDTTDYVFSTFPSTADNKYKIPVIILENNNGLELKFHNTYLQTVEGDLEITIKEGLYVTVGATKYVVGKDVCYQLSDGIWADKNATYTVTYYVNGEVYGEVEEYAFKSALVLRENVATDPGYVFSGWEYTATSGVIQDMEIYGFITAIGYEITYHLNGGVNASTNPIVYYVTDGEILLKDATKEGATFKGWYTSEDYTTKVEKLSPDQLGDMALYALFEGGDTDDEGGCGSVTGVGAGMLALVGSAILLKKKRKDTDD